MTDNEIPLSQPYLAEVLAYPIPTYTQQELIIYQARLGDSEARQAMVTGCLLYVLTVARTFSLSHNVDFDELLGIGNLVLVEKLDLALTKECPYPYLKACAKWAMLHAAQAWEHYYPLEDNAVIVEPPKQVERDHRLLYEAINKLPPNQCQAVVMHFGLLGSPRESLYSLSREESSNPKGTVMYLRLRRATNKLRDFLVQTSGQANGMGNAYPA